MRMSDSICSSTKTHDYRGFEKYLTQFSKLTLITTIALSILSIGLYLALNYFESLFDEIDNNPQGLAQKSYDFLTKLSWVIFSASLYIGLQGFLLSQILNIGYYLFYGKGAIHYRKFICLP